MLVKKKKIGLIDFRRGVRHLVLIFFFSLIVTLQLQMQVPYGKSKCSRTVYPVVYVHCTV